MSRIDGRPLSTGTEVMGTTTGASAVTVTALPWTRTVTGSAAGVSREKQIVPFYIRTSIRLPRKVTGKLRNSQSAGNRGSNEHAER